MAFNYKYFKFAQQRGQYPSHLLPPSEMERYVRDKKNPYKIDRNPNDGEGPKLTTPGSEGMLGQKSDASFQAGGKERKGYPTDYSEFVDPADSEKFDDIPGASDPDDPMTGKPRQQGETEYGKGQGTDFGEALHDDRNVHTDGYEGGTLGIEETLKRDLAGHDLDRKPSFTTMEGTENPFSRTENPFNSRMRQKGPMKYVRDKLRSAASSNRRSM